MTLISLVATGVVVTVPTQTSLKLWEALTRFVEDVIYTRLGSCRRHGLNPSDYLKDSFTRPPSAKITEVGQFTPATRARTNAKEKLPTLAA